jgi:hypothetical protein
MIAVRSKKEALMSNNNTAVIDTFQRVEDKYLLNSFQAEDFFKAARSHLKKDVYFQYHCHTIYFDNDAAQLISTSLSHPYYKMKLRLRTYSNPQPDTPVFLETKKKYGDIVYKKRFMIDDAEARDYLLYDKPHSCHNYTSEEIDYLIHYYHLKPKVYIGYDRICFVSRTEADARFTLDSHIVYRVDDLSLTENGTEKPLDNSLYILECKVSDRYPIWLTEILSQQHLYKSSFSKYGTIYRQEPSLHPVFHTAPESVYGKENLSCSVLY